jgi:hypothetical protein
LEAEWLKDPNIAADVEDDDENKPLIESIAASKSWKKGQKSRSRKNDFNEVDISAGEIYYRAMECLFARKWIDNYTFVLLYNSMHLYDIINNIFLLAL